MADKVLHGAEMKYSLVYMKEEDIELLKECQKHHEIVGYVLFNDKDYLFYSVEDNYRNAILDHWTVRIVQQYDTHSCWLVVKQHPCRLYNIITDMYKGNRVCNVDNFDTWRTDAKDCLVAVITDMEVD